MDAYETVRTVLAVREFQDKPMPAETVRRIAESGRLTGSASNRQPWHFIVVDDKQMIRELASQATSGPYVAQAPLAVVVAVEDSPFAESDASRAIQSMVLTAWADGVGSNWVGFSGRLKGVNELLSIPNELDVIAIMPFGYPARSLGKGKKQRKPASEVIHHNHFGEPFS